MKSANLKHLILHNQQEHNVLKQKVNQDNAPAIITSLKSAKGQQNLPSILIQQQQKISDNIDNINNNVHESLKQQADSWKYTTYEADKFIMDTNNWIKRYMMFLQKVQEFYDHHPEIARLTRENDKLQMDQEYFGNILNKYQEQSEVWYEKLKSSILTRNEMDQQLKRKKKKASQMLIKRINLERVIDSKKKLTEERIDQSLRRGRSNVSKTNQLSNQNSSSFLLRSLSNKKRGQNESTIICSTEASNNMLSINGSLQIGSILPSISPQVRANTKQNKSFLFDQQSRERQYKNISLNHSNQKQYNSNGSLMDKNNHQSSIDQYLNSDILLSSTKIEARDLSYLYKIGSISKKERCQTEMDVSPIIRNAKKQLETIDRIFKSPKRVVKDEYSMSAYKNLSYNKDKRREKQRRLLQNSSQLNQSPDSTLNGESKILNDISQNNISGIKKQDSNIQKKLVSNQDLIQILQKISKTKDENSSIQLENKSRILQDQSVIFLNSSDAQSILINGQTDEIDDKTLIEYERIQRLIKKQKDEIKAKQKKIYESSRKFYRIEYLFEECLESSEKMMMKKIENLQLNGFELNDNMENLLNILDKCDEVGGVKQIVKKHNNKNKLSLGEEDNQADTVPDIEDIMEYKDFQNLSTKQLLFSICRSNVMKYNLTKLLTSKREQIKDRTNEIKQLMNQCNMLSQQTKLQQHSAITDFRLQKQDSSLDIISEKPYLSNISPIQKTKKKLFRANKSHSINAQFH